MADPRPAPARRFSDAERALLAPFVTNTDQPVFVLTNLPEVIKGALFSRYSRSALGLRELLLREFIEAPEAAFAEIGGQGADAPPAASDAAERARRSRLAVERAQAFYDRILDGYGDDSIGELGGAHLALEDVSMIATKVIEDARIGGSPLEKSTRYVSFAEPREGAYLYYREPTVMASPHAARYEATCDMLFRTYAECMAPMRAYVEQAAPRPADVSESAWRRSVRARAYDALRGLLPAATLTNMGIFGNGRFFEALALKLRLGGLAELRDLGERMHGELAKVIPSFIRRAHPQHPHFAGHRDYARALAGEEAALARALAGEEAARAHERARDVELAGYDPDGPAKALAAVAYPQGGDWQALQAAAQAMSATERTHRFQQLAAARTNRRHKPPRGLELAYYTFDLVGDFGMYRDLHRHRMLTQQRQPLAARHGYELPEEVEAAGLADPFRRAMDQAAETWEAIAADHPAEAQYVVPMAYRIRWHLHANLRALVWLCELRSQAAGHPAYRHMAQELYRRVIEVHPEVAAMFRFVDLADYPLGRLGAEHRTEQKRRER